MTTDESLATPPTGQPGEWWYWVHHEEPIEPLTEPVAVRHAYVREDKPAHEIAVRLAAMQPVKDPTRLPARLVAARRAYDVVRRAYDAALAAGRAYGEAQKAYDEAWRAYDKAGMATAGMATAHEVVALYLEEYPEHAHLIDVENCCLRFPEPDQ